MKPYFLLRLITRSALKRAVKSITGLENIPSKGPFLIAANHIDFIDALFFTLPISGATNQKVCFISKTRNYYLLFPGSTIAIDPNDKNAILEKAKEKLNQGKIIAIFPEGARNSESVLLRGRTGLARLAIASGAPVLPVGIQGLSGRSFLHSIKLLRCRKNAWEINIGPLMKFSIAPDRIENGELLGSITRQIMKEIARLSHKTYNF